VARHLAPRRVVDAYLKSPSDNKKDEINMREFLCELLGCLKAIYWAHWTAHWQCAGDSSYADHLMFGRMYEATVDEIDTLAEKAVGYFGPSAVDPLKVTEIELRHLSKWPHVDHVKKALLCEQALLDYLSALYDTIKNLNMMTLGLDDFIMSLASAHETNVYLLQQRLGGKVASHHEHHHCDCPCGDHDHHHEHGHHHDHGHEDDRVALTNLEKSWGGYSTFAPRRDAQ